MATVGAGAAGIADFVAIDHIIEQEGGDDDRDPHGTQYREPIHGSSRNCWKINDFSLIPQGMRDNQSNPAWVALASGLAIGGRLSR